MDDLDEVYSDDDGMTDDDNTDDIVPCPDQLYGELLHGLQVWLPVTEPAVGPQGTGTRLQGAVLRCPGSRCASVHCTGVQDPGVYTLQCIAAKICRCVGIKVQLWYRFAQIRCALSSGLLRWPGIKEYRCALYSCVVIKAKWCKYG